MDVSFRLEGGEELEKLLRILPVRIERKIFLVALRKGAKPIKKMVRRFILRKFKTRTGTLLRSVRHRTGKGGFKSGAFIIIETSSGKNSKADAYYATFLERGVRPHSVGRKSRLAYSNAGYRRYERGQDKGKKHPGFRPKPFMAPALRASRKEAIDVFSTEVIRAIEAFVRKNA